MCICGQSFSPLKCRLSESRIFYLFCLNVNWKPQLPVKGEKSGRGGQHEGPLSSGSNAQVGLPGHNHV